MKKYLFIVAFITCLGNSSKAQKIEVKNGTVQVDDKDFLSYKSANDNYELTIYKLNTKDELIFVLYNDNQTRSYKQDDYYKIIFLGLNLKMETHNYELTWKPTIKWFIKNNLFTSNGELNEAGVKIFIEKYNESITTKNN
jgi:hypothetical protein